MTLSFYTLRGLFKLKYEIPLVDLEKDGIKFRRLKKKGGANKEEKERRDRTSFLKILEKFRSYRSNTYIINDIVKYLRKRLLIKELSLDLKIGTGDAFYTGILSGAAWGVIGIAVSYLANKFRLQRKKVRINTDFNEKKLDVDFFCIITVRLVHIIIVVLKLLINYYKTKFRLKKSTGGGENGRSSDRRAHDDSDGKHKRYG